MDFHIEIEGKHLILYKQHIYGSIFKISRQVDSDTCVIGNTLDLIVFQLFGKLVVNIAWK